MVAPEKGQRPFAENDVRAVGIHVQHERPKLREPLRRELRELREKLRALLRCDDYRRHQLPAVSAPPQEYMPQQALARLLVVGCHAAFAAEADDEVPHPQKKLRQKHTVCRFDSPVRTLRVEACVKPPLVVLRNGELRLVAVAVGTVRRDNGQKSGAQPADAREGVPHETIFFGGFVLVGDMPKAAPAALPPDGAAVLAALRRGYHELIDYAVAVILRHLYDAAVDDIPRSRVRHEYHHALRQLADAAALVRERRYLKPYCLILPWHRNPLSPSCVLA